jgi:ABC-type nitrate/sulfonate/bicarbonate transport system substrate-binding protein
MNPNDHVGYAPKKGNSWLVAGGIALAMVAAGTTATRAAECVKMMEAKVQEWTGDIINIVPWVANDERIFHKHCVTAKFIPLVSGPGSYAGMVSGTIDFANGAPDGIMRSRAQGVDLRLTGNMYAAHWSTLVGRNGLDLPHAKEGYPAIMQDLVGKKIGVTVLGGSTEAYMRSAFEGAGLSGASATFVAVGGVTTAIPALKNNVVDAAMMFGTGPDLAEALGAGKIILDFRKRGVGPAVLQALWGATLSWAAYGPFIEKNQETVAAFTTANNEAIGWIMDRKNRSAVYAVIKKHMPLPTDVLNSDATLKRIVDINADELSPGVPRASIDGWNKYLMSLKQIAQPISYDELVWKSGRP